MCCDMYMYSIVCIHAYTHIYVYVYHLKHLTFIYYFMKVEDVHVHSAASATEKLKSLVLMFSVFNFIIAEKALYKRRRLLSCK